MKQLIYFFGGVATGIFIGFVVTSNHYEEQLQLERDAMDDYYKETSEVNNVKKNKEKADKIIRSEYFVRSSLDENKEIVTDNELDIREDVYPMEERNQKPYEITEDEFHNGEFHYFDKDTIIYWDGNECLMSEDENEEFDIEDVMGFEILEKFKDGNSDRIFVRNERLGTDYEIVYNPNKYEKFNEEE